MKIIPAVFMASLMAGCACVTGETPWQPTVTDYRIDQTHEWGGM